MFDPNIRVINGDDMDAKLAQYKRLKVQLNNVLHCATQYCGICMSTEKHTYYSLHDPIDTGHWRGEDRVTLQIILLKLFGDLRPLVSSSVCEDCRGSAISAHLFIYNAQRTSEIIDEYIHQMDAGLEQIFKEMDDSNVDQFANTLIVLQDPDSCIKKPTAGNESAENDDRDDSEDYCNGDEDDDNYGKNDDEDYSIREEVNFIQLSESEIDDTNSSTKQSTKPNFQKKSNGGRKARFSSCFECKKTVCIHHKFLQSYMSQRTAGKKKICCPLCKYVCWSKLQLMGHANKIHLNNYKFVCEYCAKPLYSKYSYNTHVRTYHKEQNICEYCRKPFSNTQNYMNHKDACSLRKPKSYKCSECPSSFTTEAKRNNHAQIHSKVNRFPCDLCNRVVSSEYLLKNHLEIVHMDDTVKKDKNQYECSICHEEFSTLKEKKYHMKNHSQGEKHQCIECNKTFDAQYQYRNHINSVDHKLKINPNEEFPYKCTECNFSTISSGKLEAHLNGHHLKIAPYICEHCGQKFTSKNTLTQHRQLTHGNKKYPCSICGNLLGSNIALIKHVRLHTGERPYPCDLCSEKFVSASHRKMHQLRAHGEKNIKCPLCENMFHTISNMRVHFKKRHWASKDEKFDITKVPGLKPEDYDMFRDKRQLDFLQADTLGSTFVNISGCEVLE